MRDVSDKYYIENQNTRLAIKTFFFPGNHAFVR